MQDLHSLIAEALGPGGPRPSVLAAWVLGGIAVALVLAPLAPRVRGWFARPAPPQGTLPVLDLAKLLSAVEQLKGVVADGRTMLSELQAVEPAMAAAVADIEMIGTELAQVFASLQPAVIPPVAAGPTPTPTPTPRPNPNPTPNPTPSPGPTPGPVPVLMPTPILVPTPMSPPMPMPMPMAMPMAMPMPMSPPMPMPMPAPTPTPTPTPNPMA